MRDAPIFNGILHLMIEHGWVDRELLASQTVGFDDLARTVAEWAPALDRRGHRHHRIGDPPGRAEWWGTAQSSF